MVRKSRRNVSHSASRTVLSECLPYELPVTFNNKGFYDFLRKSSPKVVNGDLIFDSTDNTLKHLLAILAGGAADIHSNSASTNNSWKIQKRSLATPTVPLSYKVRHRGLQTRQLSIAHPFAQLSVVNFYEKYKNLILYHTSRSNYSVRRPSKVTRYTFVRDQLFQDLNDKTQAIVEVAGSEYESLRSYFVYKKYNNVHKFYESAEYRNNEKKYGHLLRLDVTKCFDSIYTHSIEWAIHGKELVKQNKSHFDDSFARNFDKVIRQLNDDETHGIVIGPEISRIFAEIILQRVDREVETELDTKGLKHGRDYDVLRYVDDYFIFIRTPELRDHIVPVLEKHLQPFRLHLNVAKEEINSTPFISDMSIAKDRISRLIDSDLRFSENLDAGDEASIFFKSSSKQLIAHYKTVIKQTGVLPEDITNFTLAKIEQRLENSLEYFSRLASGRLSHTPGNLAQNKEYYFRTAAKLISAAIELSFYVYGGSPRVAPAIKLSRTVALVRKFMTKARLLAGLKNSVDEIIFNDCVVQLNRNPISEDSSIESLYILTILGELGEHYLLSIEDLCRLVGIDLDSKVDIPKWHNVLTVLEIIRYIKNYPEYQSLKDRLESYIVDRVVRLNDSKRYYAEQPFLVFGSVSSPFISKATKKKLLRIFRVETNVDVDQISDSADRWFYNWKDFDLHAELQFKRVHEVY